jgi:hypothetical protein
MDDPLPLEEKAAAPLAGGIASYGYQCGMFWGSTLAAGARAYRILGEGPEAQTAALTIAMRLVTSLSTCNRRGEMNCLEITELNLKGKIQVPKILKFLFSGGAIGCFTMAGKCAKAAFKDINTVLAKKDFDVPSPPVSCASLMAQKLGTSGQHQVMVAGLAGGIGLSGGACGALGAAIWLDAVNKGDFKASNKALNSRAGEIINKFVKISDYQFECSKIVGRKFDSIADHSAFLKQGGCARIIEPLAIKP